MAPSTRGDEESGRPRPSIEMPDNTATAVNNLAEPFRLMGEIENLTRTLLAMNVAVSETTSTQHEGDKPIREVSDLTSGQSVRQLENHGNRTENPLNVDEEPCVKEPNEVRKARDDASHFECEGVGLDRLRVPRTFERSLKEFV